MTQRDGLPPMAARRRGRPVGSDSAETRNRILKASRLVINERGYAAATFQAIAIAAGLSRPTLHYYFASREEIYRALVVEADVVVAECIVKAQRFATLSEQLSAFATAIHEADLLDRSQIAFLISARLESRRNPALRAYTGGGVLDFLSASVAAAADRGELHSDTALAPIVDMLDAMLWGVGFHAGFIADSADRSPITKQLDRLFSHGLLDANNSATSRDTLADTPSIVGGRS